MDAEVLKMIDNYLLKVAQVREIKVSIQREKAVPK
jgi:hypothetical protein